MVAWLIVVAEEGSSVEYNITSIELRCAFLLISGSEFGATAHNTAHDAFMTLSPYTSTRSDLGDEYFDQLDTARVQRHHVRRLEQLGYSVTLTPKEAA